MFISAMPSRTVADAARAWSAISKIRESREATGHVVQTPLLPSRCFRRHPPFVRYAWAERGRRPVSGTIRSRGAGHNSIAVHRAYAKKSQGQTAQLGGNMNGRLCHCLGGERLRKTGPATGRQFSRPVGGGEISVFPVLRHSAGGLVEQSGLSESAESSTVQKNLWRWARVCPKAEQACFQQHGNFMRPESPELPPSGQRQGGRATVARREWISHSYADGASLNLPTRHGFSRNSSVRSRQAHPSQPGLRLILGEVEFFFNLTLATNQFLVTLLALEVRPNFGFNSFARLLASAISNSNLRARSSNRGRWIRANGSC